MQSTHALRWSLTVLICFAIAAGAFWLGRRHPAAPAAERASAVPKTTVEAAPNRSISFRPFAEEAPDVFAKMARMREQMDVMRAQAFGSAPADRTGLGAGAITLEDKGERYEASMAADGLKNGKVDVSIESGMLVVQGRTQARQHDADHVTRSGSSSFHYRLSLPADAEPGSLKTECSDNRIIITLMKRTTKLNL